MKFYIPTQIFQERNCIRNHINDLSRLGTHALIVTGKHSSKVNGSLNDLCDTLKQANLSYTIFDRVEENPSIETCVEAARLGLKENVDFCIGLGGGSPLDAAKAIALLIGEKTIDGSLFFEKKQTVHPLAVVCIPTTAGTGSEATPYAILTKHAQHTKQSIQYQIFPTLSLCDPTYLNCVPFQVLKNTAIDALAHLIESYLNTNATSYSRMFCERGLKLWGSIRDDLCDMSLTNEGFDTLMETATIAGMAISHTGTSIPHGLSYPLTYELSLSHGAACGLFLPGYLNFCSRQADMNKPCKSNAMTTDDVAQIFSLLGIKSLQEFALMLYSMLGDLTIPNDLWEKDLTMLLENPQKLNNCPYSITKQDLDAFI